MRLGVVIVCYSEGRGNRKEIALESLRSFFDSTCVVDDDVTVYIVENGSTDDLAECIWSVVPMQNNVHVLPIRKNIGCGAAKRIGIDTMLVENPDVDMIYVGDDDIIYQSGWLPKAIHIFDSLIQHNIGLLGLWRHRTHRVIASNPWHMDPRYHILMSQDVPGCCVFFKTETYKNTRGWPRRHNGDDVEFTREIQKQGKHLFTVTPPFLFHKATQKQGGEDIPYKEQHEAENKTFIKW